jgi:predicted kinase
MLLLNIGLPGSGKSTLVKTLQLPLNEFVRVSPDQIRSEQFGVTYNRRVEPQVWTITKALVEGQFRLGKSVYLDATNLARAWRRPWIQLAQHYRHKSLAVYFDMPIEQILAQNQLRSPEWVVPESVIRGMHRSLHVPSLEEGFDAVVRISHVNAEEIQRVTEAMEALEKEKVIAYV